MEEVTPASAVETLCRTTPVTADQIAHLEDEAPPTRSLPQRADEGLECLECGRGAEFMLGSIPRCRRHTIAHLREEVEISVLGMRLVGSRAGRLGPRVPNGVVVECADGVNSAPAYTYHCAGCGIRGVVSSGSLIEPTVLAAMEATMVAATRHARQCEELDELLRPTPISGVPRW